MKKRKKQRTNKVTLDLQKVKAKRPLTLEEQEKQKIDKVTKNAEHVEIKRRRDWLENHNAIERAMFDYILAHKQRPTLDNLSQLTGISVTNIHKHIKELSLDDIIPEFKMMGDKVIMGMMKAAMEGSSSAADFFMELIFKHLRKSGIDIKGDFKVGPQSITIGGKEITF